MRGQLEPVYFPNLRSSMADADRKAELMKKKQRLEELRRSREERASRRQEARDKVSGDAAMEKIKK